ncbi:hypothetical protein [Solitalea lacus]|uniref:hypothetical protein n=1 Tax=Solitalea lacus TaxID=2911172 RepID=UPI001EDA579B|nr:hypothetical protein [Solitalea lacus]UKJ09184.1 hypothetical protein L2B55_08505 [Solitalea lacus]
MKTTYFAHRKPFSFSFHPYQIGSPIGLSKGYEDNHFLLKIYQLKEEHYGDYYQFHLAYFLEKHPHSDAKHLFFEHVWSIVVNRISYYRNSDPFSSKHTQHIHHIEKLTCFKQHLISIDEWNKTLNFSSLLAEWERQLTASKERIKQLESEIQQLRQHESAEKISIAEDKLPTFIDLLQQLQELTLPNNKSLLKSQTQSPWYKLLSRYFLHGEKEIPINTARNYFPAQKSVKLIKGSEVPQKDKHFQIIPLKCN